MSTLTVPRLKAQYQNEIRDQLQESLGLGNVMEVPRLEKIVLNVGCGEATEQRQLIDKVTADLTIIAGQKPIATRAKKSIAGFKLREGNVIGVKVTLRGDRMWEFLDRLVTLALPRVRDFRGINPRGFDGAGNYTLGLKEQIVFPEIDFDKVDKVKGMNITFVTSAETDEEAKELLGSLGMPFRS